MKILYVITKANWGGAQRYVYDLATAAKAQGDEVAVAYGTVGTLSERLAAADIRTLPLEGLGRDLRLKGEWRAFRSLLALMRSERPDVVHVNSSKGGLALVAARFARVPRILFTAHGWAFNEQRAWWQKLLLRTIYVCTVLLSHETICVSEAVRRESGLSFLGKKLTVIRNGIEVSKLRPKRSARNILHPTDEKKIWLGILAELHPSKRIEDALQAMNELAPEFPDLKLFVIGEGEERVRLEEFIETHGLRERVYLLGFVPDAASYLSAFDVFLMISRTEALGYALLEAGAAGLPVVATRVGGIPEVIVHGESGTLVPPENPASIARAVRTYLGDPARMKAHGAALKERITNSFSKESMTAQTFERYQH